MGDDWIPAAIERRDAREWEQQNMTDEKNLLDEANNTIEEYEACAQDLKWRAEKLIVHVAGTDFDHPIYPVISWLHGIATACAAFLGDEQYRETLQQIAKYEAIQREIEQ